MKIIVLYDACASAELHHKLAITLPAKWMDQSAYGEGPLRRRVQQEIPERTARGGRACAGARRVAVHRRRHEAAQVGRHARLRGEGRGAARAEAGGGGGRRRRRRRARLPPGMLRRKNYCQKVYDPSANCDGACRHHKAGPIFHDTRKWWSCCERRRYSFDELFEIPGCASGLPPTRRPPRSCASRKAGGDGGRVGHPLVGGKPGADGAAAEQNVEAQSAARRAAEAAAAAARPRALQALRLPGRVLDRRQRADAAGTTRARRLPRGAKKGVPASAYDFDEFLAVLGCVTGPRAGGRSETVRGDA